MELKHISSFFLQNIRLGGIFCLCVRVCLTWCSYSYIFWSWTPGLKPSSGFSLPSIETLGVHQYAWLYNVSERKQLFFILGWNPGVLNYCATSPDSLYFVLSQDLTKQLKALLQRWSWLWAPNSLVPESRVTEITGVCHHAQLKKEILIRILNESGKDLYSWSNQIWDVQVFLCEANHVIAI